MSLPHFHTGSESLAATYAADGTLPSGVVGLELEDAVMAHMRTLRLRPSERFVLVGSDGSKLTCELASALPPSGKGGMAQTIRAVVVGRAAHKPPTTEITLVQGIAVSSRMDQIVRQVTELGVARVVPLKCMRSTVRLDADGHEQKRERWQRLARAAAEQSMQAAVPQIERPCGLAEAITAVEGCDVVLAAWEEWRGQGVRAVLHETLQVETGCPVTSDAASTEGGDVTRAAPAAPGRSPDKLHVALFVGPEGGFDAGETDAMRAAGIRLVSLGPTILRTETAAVVMAALVLHELGGLGNRWGM
ncbi:MAG: 16S rRNA (uracil(1498)-N(3))-methyltransferase [Coriobacteriales bacterium]|nr:16S rRNA (uracil(1498)-N(3))-methyltransferase [Coriobacteriales bacterium]